MIDPYRMVFVNVIALGVLIVLLGLFYFYLHKKIKGVVIVLLFSILPIISVLRKGAYESGDFTIQIYRAIDFFNSLSQGILLPRWGAELNATYGHPIFIFAAPLPYYVISFFHLFGFSFIASTKLLLITAFIGSGLTMYYFVKKYYGEKAGIVAAIFYLYTPFHLVDLHFRVSLGDTLAFALYPLAFLFLTNLFYKPKFRDFLLLTLVTFLLVISHPITIYGLIFLGVYFLFLIYAKRSNIKNIFLASLGLATGMLLSSIYWLPLIIESSNTHEALLYKEVLFTNFWELIYSPWMYGFLFQGHSGELSFILGYAQILIIIISVYFLISSKFNKNIKKLVILLLSSLFVILFMITPHSNFIWDAIPLLKSLNITYRLLFIVVFIMAFLAGITVSKISNKWVVIFIVLFAVSTTILNWGNRRTIPEINDTYLKNNLPYSTHEVEGHKPSLPIWRDIENSWMSEIPKYSLEIIKGSGDQKQISVKQNSSSYLISNKVTIEVRRNLFYFPGWKVYDNGKVIKINFENEGFVEFGLNPGIHKVDIVFEDTKARKNAKYLFLFGIFIIFAVFLLNLSKKRRFFN